MVSARRARASGARLARPAAVCTRCDAVDAPPKPPTSLYLAAVAAVLLLACVPAALAQSGATTEGALELTPAQSAFREIIVAEKYNNSQDDLTFQLVTTRRDYVAPGLDHTVYQFERPPIDDKGRADYRMQVIIDPCRAYPPTCCDGIFGAPEFRNDPTDMDESPKTSDGNVKSPLTSRLPDPANAFDESCTTDADNLNPSRVPLINYLPSELPNGVEIITDEEPPLLPGEDGSRCIAYKGAILPFPQFPRCWDYNTSVDSTKNCEGIGGTAPNCLMVGYSCTGYITECGSTYQLNGRCGTFLEIHKPDDNEVLSEVQVSGGMHTGFRLTALPLNWKKDPNRLLCRGDYEVWWVQRTRWNSQIEYKKKFRIEDPACTFDLLKSEYKVYRETKVASELFDNAAPGVYDSTFLVGL